MADRYTIDTTRFIPPNLRGIASTLGLDDASNMNAVVSMFMRPRTLLLVILSLRSIHLLASARRVI